MSKFILILNFLFVSNLFAQVVTEDDVNKDFAQFDSSFDGFMAGMIARSIALTQEQLYRFTKEAQAMRLSEYELGVLKNQPIEKIKTISLSVVQLGTTDPLKISFGLAGSILLFPVKVISEDYKIEYYTYLAIDTAREGISNTLHHIYDIIKSLLNWDTKLTVKKNPFEKGAERLIRSSVKRSDCCIGE